MAVCAGIYLLCWLEIAYLKSRCTLCRLKRRKKRTEGKWREDFFHGTVDPKDNDGHRDTNCPECVQVAFEVRIPKSQLAFFCTCTFDSPGI